MGARDYRRAPSGSSDSWRTPEHVLELARNVMGEFDLDPYTDPDNYTRARYIFTPQSTGDGMALWTNGATWWINPPYSGLSKRVPEIAQRASLNAYFGGQVILLIPPNTDTSYWRKCLTRGAEYRPNARCLWYGRMAFVGPGGRPVKGNTKGSSLHYWGARTGLFRTMFEPHGEITLL